MGIIVRQSIKGTIVNYIGVGIGFITTFFIVTKYLTTEELGLVRVLTQSSLLIATLAQLGTNTSAMRYYPYFKDNEHRDHGFFGWTLIVPFVGFALFTALFFIFKDTFTSFFIAKSALFVDYINYVLPLAFFMLYITVFETNSNLLLRIVVPKFIREVAIRLLTMAVYILYAFHILTLTGMVVSLCVVYGLATLLNIIYLFTLKRVSFRIEPEYVKPQLRHDFTLYTLFLFTSALTTEFAPMLNDYFVAGMQGLASAGVFSIAVYVATLVEMPYRSLAAISRPHISQAIADNDIAKTNEICKSVSLNQFLIGSLIFFVIWVNIDAFFTILPNGENYAIAKWVVFILGISRLCNSTLNVGLTALSYSKHYYFSLVFSILLTGLSIFLNYKLIPIWGIEGAALATLASYLLYYLLMTVFVGYKIKMNPLTIKHIWVIGIIVGMFGLAWLWDSTITTLLVQNTDYGVGILLADSIAKTVLICIIGIVAFYKAKVSFPFNEIIKKALGVLRLGNKQ